MVFFQCVVLVCLFGVGLCWPSADGYLKSRSDQKCHFLEASPFFRSAPTRKADLKEEMVFLTEFARFMNGKVPALLKVRSK